jgi:hypothetical protein
MKPIDKFLITSYDKADAWRDHEACYHDYESDMYLNDDRNCITDKSCLLSIEWMMEVSRPLVERDYHYDRKYVYDYYFKLKDGISIYAVQTNIKMRKYFNGKWYWNLDSYKSRMFKFDHDLSWNNIFINTYPVDEDGKIFCINDDSDDYEDELSHKEKCVQQLYDLDDSYDEEMKMNYCDEIFKSPYTSLEFFDDIPKEAMLLKIPKVQEFSKSQIAEQIALILTVSPTRCFSSGK